jgi:hypothetical protein
VETKFIELTHALIAAGGISAGLKHIIGVAHIAMVKSSGAQTSIITLSDGSVFQAMETYEDLKRMLGL